MKNINHSQEKIDSILEIVENLFEKKYKLDNFRSILEKLLRLLDLKFLVYINERIAYYIDEEKYFYISNPKKIEKYKSFLKHLLEKENMVVLNNCHKHYRIFRNLKDISTENFLFIKLTSDIYIIGGRELPLTRKEINILSKIKNVIKKSLGQDYLENTLIEQAYTDHLTGLYNRRFFESLIPIEIERAKRYKYPLSIVYLDIDNFKLVNDKYGHSAGDIFLKQFGTLIKSILRKADIPLRIGGDEFILFLPFTRKKDAQILAYKLRKLLKENLNLLCENKNCDFVDISFGILEIDKFDNIETILSRADFLMYQAKKLKKEEKDFCEEKL